MRLLLVALSGCATLADGGRATIRLDTHPEYSKAIVDGAVHPGDATLDLDPGRDHAIVLRKPGYADRSIEVRSQVNPWFWGNFAFGPLFFVGMIVDAASGAIDRLDADSVAVTLEPIEGRAGEIARRGVAISDAIERERITLGDLAPAASETDRWVVAVNGEMADMVRLSLAARGVRIAGDRSELEALKLESYADGKREESQIPLGTALAATHAARSTLQRFGETCVTGVELIDLETEVTTRAAMERSGCAPEDLLHAVERLTARLIRASMTAGPVAARKADRR